MAEFTAEPVARGGLPVVAITMGDPAGVGPEVAVKALRHDVVWEACRPLLVGDPAVLEAAARICGSHGAVVPVPAPPGAEVAAAWDRGRINVVASGSLESGELRRGEASAAAGDAGYRAIAAAVRLAQRGAAAATVTGPIHKEALNRAGHHFAGQTEIYAHLTGTRDYAMLLMAGALRVVHVSTHVSLREACARVTRERVGTVIRLAHGAGQMLGLPRPRIGVAGLNPHAGDGGLFGSEEADEIIPAVRAAQADGIAAEGPLPADTLFPKANGGFYEAEAAKGRGADTAIFLYTSGTTGNPKGVVLTYDNLLSDIPRVVAVTKSDLDEEIARDAADTLEAHIGAPVATISARNAIIVAG